MERVAIIGGTGGLGFGLGSRWAKSGLEVVIGSRDEGRASDAARRLGEAVPGGRALGMVNEEAARSTQVVVVTVPFAAQAATYKSIGGHLPAGAVVVDCTVPLAAATGGKASHTLGVWQGSAAGQASSLLDGVTLCSAFHSLSASVLADLEHDLEGDVLACGPRSGKEAVGRLVEGMPGLRLVDAGPLENARLIEPLTALLIGLNRRYKVHGAGLRITGLPDRS